MKNKGLFSIVHEILVSSVFYLQKQVDAQVQVDFGAHNVANARQE